MIIIDIIKQSTLVAIGVVIGAILQVKYEKENTKPDHINTDYDVAISIPVKDVFNVYIEDQYIDKKLYRIVIAELNGQIISVKDCFTKAPILLPVEVELCKQGLIKT